MEGIEQVNALIIERLAGGGTVHVIGAVEDDVAGRRLQSGGHQHLR